MEQVRFGPELISRLLNHLCEELSGCLGAGVNVWSASERCSIMAIGLAEQLDPVQHHQQRGPLIEAGHTEQQVCVDDLVSDERWAALATEAPEHELIGFVGLPGGWNSDGPVVLSAYLDHKPTNEDLRVIERVEPLLTIASAVVEFCAGEVLRADQMINMVQHRRLIEQAKGLVMATRTCSAGSAFRILARASQHFNVKLRDLCAGLVFVVGGTVEEPDQQLLGGQSPMAEPSLDAQRAARLVWRGLRGKDG